MRHLRAKRKFGRKSGPRQALIKNLLKSLVLYEKARTTEAKAKEIRPLIERLITRAKVDNLNNRREALKKLGGRKVVKKLFEVISPRYQTKKGGYTRIVKLGERCGDNAKMAMIELI